MTPDREQLAEALAEAEEFYERWGHHEHLNGAWEILAPVVAAARAWLDQGDALVIRKVNGEWPWEVLDAWAKVGGSAVGAIAFLDALAEIQALSDRSDGDDCRIS